MIDMDKKSDAPSNTTNPKNNSSLVQNSKFSSITIKFLKFIESCE